MRLPFYLSFSCFFFIASLFTFVRLPLSHTRTHTRTDLYTHTTHACSFDPANLLCSLAWLLVCLAVSLRWSLIDHARSTDDFDLPVSTEIGNRRKGLSRVKGRCLPSKTWRTSVVQRQTRRRYPRWIVVRRSYGNYPSNREQSPPSGTLIVPSR